MSDSDSIHHELQAILGYYELGMWEEALAEIAEAETRQGGASSPKLDELRITVCQVAQRWAEMRAVAEKAAEREPDKATWLLSWAYALRREVSIRAAREVLERALTLHPTEALISFNLACYTAQVGEIELSGRHLARALQLDPKLAGSAQRDPDLEPLRRGGNLPLPAASAAPAAAAAGSEPAATNESAALRVYVRHLREGDAATRAVALHALVKARAEPVFTALLAAEEPAVAQLASRGLAECWLNEAGEAARHHLEKGIAAMEGKDYPAAEKLFRRLMREFPNWAEVVNKLATLCYLCKRYDESLLFCRRVVAMKPDHFGAWQGMELCAVQLRDWPAALEAARQSLRLQPQHPAHREMVKSLEAKLHGS